MSLSDLAREELDELHEPELCAELLRWIADHYPQAVIDGIDFFVHGGELDD